MSIIQVCGLQQWHIVVVAGLQPRKHIISWKQRWKNSPGHLPLFGLMWFIHVLQQWHLIIICRFTTCIVISWKKCIKKKRTDKNFTWMPNDKVFIMPLWFLPESGHSCGFLWNLVESFLAGSPAKIAILGTNYSGGIEPFRNWDRNGPRMVWNRIWQNAIK